MNATNRHTAHEITTVIFDLDGLLADTEKLHRRAYQDVLLALGVMLSDDVYGEHWIRAGKGIAEYLQTIRSSLDPNAIREAKAIRYKELILASVEPMPGAHAALQRLTGNKTLALATASYPDGAHAVLQTLGIETFFDCIATYADAPRTKPHPDVFLHVTERLGVSARHCVVVEDSEKGIIAAHAAGMRCIAIPNLHTREHSFELASRRISSLDELTLELLEQI